MDGYISSVVAGLLASLGASISILVITRFLRAQLKQSKQFSEMTEVQKAINEISWHIGHLKQQVEAQESEADTADLEKLRFQLQALKNASDGLKAAKIALDSGEYSRNAND